MYQLKLDRLLSNQELLHESSSVYVNLSRFVLPEKPSIILVDWSNAGTQNNHCILRASIVTERRGMALYQYRMFNF